MDIKYNVTKLRENKSEEIKDHVSVEEPLEMNLCFKNNGNWETENLSITMRTPGNDEDLIAGFLFNERIIENINQILIDLLIADLDYSLREQGIGDMSIGKYVKKYVKKFYYRLSIIDKNAVSVLPDPVGEQRSKCSPSTIDGIAIFCGSVKSGNLSLNHLQADFIELGLMQ